MAVEFAFEERRDERPTKLFQRGYTRKKKNATIIPSPSFNTPLDDTSMSSDDSSETNLKLSSMSIPSHFQEALEDPKWKSAMGEEMKAL
ncbi:hypothetical protein CK203_039744 [Vitis vinifera]|uniref:Uncharacterized protein n=1 Tax=Vitis vinifera TaxID=29760 RepID=A0A438HTS5_VITVI|nr:hypothetical protein CK203_039744 [Vitis vinifera]